VFITHYHDDHTDRVSKLVDAFGATVHASMECRDVLENPGAYRLPAMTANSIHVSGVTASGSRWKWKEFEMSLFYFPGQTLFHDALLVKKDDGGEILFAGDSFTPTGIDDYCLLNRNLLGDRAGYLYCLDLIEREAPRALLVNQHVGPTFRFSAEQIRRMRSTLEERIELLSPLVPWDDPNWAVDEGWARFSPYGSEVAPGEAAHLRLSIRNHSPSEQVFHVSLRPPEGWVTEALRPDPVRVPAGRDGVVKVALRAPADAKPGLRVLTADIGWRENELKEWLEALLVVTR
jgi:glyoxylase-like metal-dependent hydrolase (beta-lactamase superfamily II)